MIPLLQKSRDKVSFRTAEELNEKVLRWADIAALPGNRRR